MLSFRRFFPFFCCLVFIAIGILRISAGYSIFTQTNDEIAHLGAGMELLDLHRFDYETKHPPLPRMMIAALPYLDGLSPSKEEYARHPGYLGMWEIGDSILYKNNNYFHNLTLARMGILPFYVIAILTLWAWAKRFYNTRTAVIATLLFSTTPTILAHSMLATTDMALTAMFSLALFSLLLWLEHPSRKHSAFLGVAAGLALLSKMSALILLPVMAKVIALYKQETSPGTVRPSLKEKGILIISLSLTIWTGYLFINFPAYLGFERLIDGFSALLWMQQKGHAFYFLGKTNVYPLYYFPFMLAVKTPLGFLLLFIAGTFATLKYIRSKPYIPVIPLIVIAIFLAITVLSKINLGTRHVLAIYPFMALIAAYGTLYLWETFRHPCLRAIPVLLISWHLVSSALAHPYYLAYFNETVQHPENIALDSDLDWGQDLYLLAQYVKERQISLTSLYYFGIANTAYFGLPAQNDCTLQAKSSPYKPGWYAVSFSCLKVRKAKELHWLQDYTPVAKIGSSILLYHIQ